MDNRARITVKGRVQKAGFREYVDERAFELGLRGYVENLDNGAVEIVCEGPAEKLALMAEKVNINTYPIRVDSLEIAFSEPTGEFTDFEMVPDPGLDRGVPQGFSLLPISEIMRWGERWHRLQHAMQDATEHPIWKKW